MKIKKKLLAFALVLAATATAQAQDRQQTRFYEPNGQSIGTAVPLGDASVRYYDARGHSLATSTTTGNTTTFYDERGRPTGSFQFDGRMRRPAR